MLTKALHHPQRIGMALVVGSLLLSACAPTTLAPAATSTLALAATLPARPPATAQPATAAPTRPPATRAPIVINSLQDLRAIIREIATAAPAAAQARADELWQGLTASQRVPLILGEEVVFFYKGQATQVSWPGSFNGWTIPGLPGARIGQTDLWVGQIALPAASRAEYKIVLNGKDWIVDPANPQTQFSGLTGANNVVVMPGFTVTDVSQKRADVPAGTLTGGLSITSQYLGYAVNYWVYTPAGYDGLKQLPVLYVLDGNDFVDGRMGAMPNVLDNMLASGRIQPVMAVFVDAREPGNPQHNRREAEFLAHPEEHAQFIASELVPVIDRTYRTDPRPQARVIVGVSYGGVSAAFIALSQSPVFHKLAAFSPAFGIFNNPNYLIDSLQITGVRRMQPIFNEATVCGGDTGFTCPRLPLSIFLTTGVPSWDVGDFTELAASIRQQGMPLEFHQVREGHTWSHWRGLTDEMLTYFFGQEG